jgi:aminoglycoside phosphotransferase (APT) family kinase protein
MRNLPRSRAAVARTAALAGPRASVAATTVLAGGTHAGTYLVRTAGPEREFILREFDPGDSAAGDETGILEALDGLGGLAPRVLASDPDGDPPWTVISRLPGQADIAPADPAGFARQLGETLARIHAAPASQVDGFRPALDRPRSSRAALDGPAAAVVAARWAELAGQPAALAHCDYWSGNTVWRDGTLTGVVDWSGAAFGPRSLDLGWGRLDLYLLYDQRIADEFVAAYRTASGAAVQDLLLLDLWSVARSHETVETWEPNYVELGRGDLTAAELRRRHTAWTEYLLGRCAGGW